MVRIFPNNTENLRIIKKLGWFIRVILRIFIEWEQQACLKFRCLQLDHYTSLLSSYCSTEQFQSRWRFKQSERQHKKRKARPIFSEPCVLIDGCNTEYCQLILEYMFMTEQYRSSHLILKSVLNCLKLLTCQEQKKQHLERA